jgi:hypothetical protein
MLGAGAGTMTCGEFGKLYAVDPEKVENLFYDWSQGFMTALNLRASGKPKVLNAVTMDDQKAHLRIYCDAHPLKTYAEGVIELYHSLPESTEP